MPARTFADGSDRLSAVSAKHPTAKEFLNSSDPATERDFLVRLVLPNGTFMTTHEGRFSDLNAYSAQFMQEFSRPCEAMDVAASSGISSYEWLEYLQSRGMQCSMTATDLTAYLELVRPFPGLSFLVDEHRNILRFDIGALGVSPNTNTVLKPVKLAIIKLFRMRDTGKLPSQQFLLKSKRANGIAIEKDDIFAPNVPGWINRFDAIRAANILNKTYFSPERLRAGFITLKQRLREDGLLIISRTHERSVNRATIFRLSKGTLRILGRLNGGSEVEDIALGA